MGHTRLGELPRTRKWQEVVELIAIGANVSQIANATIRAAENAFSYVTDDTGYNQSVWLLAQFALAAKTNNPLDYLRQQGVDIPDRPTLSCVTAAMSDALDRHVSQEGKHSDLGELSMRALVDTVVSQVASRVQEKYLFDMGHDIVRLVMNEFDTPKKFGELSRNFYSRLTYESLNYFLSLTTRSAFGEGHPFATMNQVAHFEEALKTHCYEASKIVEQFSGEWFSLHRYEEKGDISRDSVEGFASYALKKMKDELKAGAKSDAT